MHYPEILAIAPEPAELTYDDKFTMLYALGLGCGVGPDELNFVYEKDLQALPTMAVMMAQASGEILAKGGIDYTMIVHGEQRLELHRPLPPTARMLSQARCLGVEGGEIQMGMPCHRAGDVDAHRCLRQWPHGNAPPDSRAPHDRHTRPSRTAAGTTCST